MLGELVRTAVRSESAAVLSSRTIKLLLVAIAAWAGIYARVALGPLQETMRAALSLTDHQIALLQGPAAGLSVVFASVPIGLLIDRYSRVRLIMVFATANLLGSVLTAFAPNFAVLFGARCLVGVSAIGCVIAAFSLIADLYAADQRGRATMVVAAGADLAFPAAFALGGALLAIYSTGLDGWRWALLWMTVPPLVLVAVLMLGLSEPPRTGVVVKKPPLRTTFPELWQRRTVVAPLLVARAMVGVADGATLVWAAPFLARAFNLPPERVGGLMATVLLIAGLAAAVLGGFVADFCHRTGGPRRTMQAMSALALLSVPACLFAVAPGPMSATFLLGAFITLGFTANTAGAALSTIVIPNHLRGTYFSLSMVAGQLFGAALAPLLVSSLSAAFGGPALIGKALAVVSMTFSLLGFATFALGSRYFERK